MDIFHIIMISGLTINFICVILSIVLSLRAIISLEAMKQSTHQMEYVPFNPKESKIEEFEENQRFGDPETDVDDLEDSEIDLRKMI